MKREKFVFIFVKKIRLKKVFISVTNDLVSDQRVHKLASSLQNASFEITLIGRRLKNSKKLSSRPYKTKRMRLLFNTGPLFYFEYNFRLFFFLIFSNTDILLSNDLDTLPANYLVSLLKKNKLVYDSHEYFTEVPELIGRKTKKYIWELIERNILPRLKFSYTVCESIADIYNKKYNIDMKVVRNIPKCKEKKTILEDKERKKNIILYQGAVNIGRGIEHLIRAMHYINNAEFWIIGDGDELEKLKKMVDDEELKGKVIFFGKIPFEQLSEYTRQAKVGISLEENIGLNYYYALPNKLFDYIHAGIPVLGSDLPEISAIINKYDIGLISNSHDKEHLAGLIKKMITNEELRKNWKPNLEIASQELCWENEEKVLLSLFEN